MYFFVGYEPITISKYVYKYFFRIFAFTVIIDEKLLLYCKTDYYFRWKFKYYILKSMYVILSKYV